MSKPSIPSQTTQTTINPTQQAQLPFLQNLWNNTQNLGASGANFNAPGFEQVANFTPQQTQALDLQAQRGLSGSPVTNAAQGYATNLLSGNFLDAGNPFFTNMVGQIGQAIQPQIDAHFNTNGRFGSGANDYSFASALANQAGSLAFQNYNDVLKQMQAESFNAPALANQDYFDISQLFGSGATSQQQQQQFINEAIQKFGQNQIAPWTLLSQEANLFGQPTAGSSTGFGTQSNFDNPAGNAIGLLGGTASIGRNLFGSGGVFPGALQGLLGGGSAGALTASDLAALSAIDSAAPIATTGVALAGA